MFYFAAIATRRRYFPELDEGKFFKKQMGLEEFLLEIGNEKYFRSEIGDNRDFGQR